MSEESDLAESFRVGKFLIRARFGQTQRLVPFGDIHRFSPTCAEERWLEFLENERRQKDSWYLGMGDYLDLMSTSERRAFKSAEFHESTIETMEEWYDGLIEKFAKEIGFMRGRLVGLLDGNHSIHFSDGTTSVQRLCRKLGCRYYGYTGFLKLQFAPPGKTRCASRTSVTILATHGFSSSSATIAGGMTAVERSERIAIADLYLQGHNHQKGALPFSRIELMDTKEKMKVVEKRGYFVRTGSFLRAYVPDKRSYSSRRMLRPTDLGVAEILMTLTRRGDRRNGNQQPLYVDLKTTL